MNNKNRKRNSDGEEIDYFDAEIALTPAKNRKKGWGWGWGGKK